MSAARQVDFTPAGRRLLYVAFELSWGEWKLAFSTGPGQPPRIKNVPARQTFAVMAEIVKAKQRFGLPANAPVVCCYEAGRDGFWLHRFLVNAGVENIVVDSASIEVNRHKRRPKSDRLDAVKLLSMLMRWHRREDDHVWKVVHVPAVADEDGRHLHRELFELKGERTTLANRIKGLLAGMGLKDVVDAALAERIEQLKLWDGTAVPPGIKQRILNALERWLLVERLIHQLEAQRERAIREDPSPQGEQIRRLLMLRGIGSNGAWLLVREVFGWRKIRHWRQLGSLAGLTPTPYGSGQEKHEQGISKAGNRLVRWMMVQLAWCWLQYQPASKLSRWYRRRYGSGSSRMRKIGIVAVARKLLVALWRYLENGTVPAGAVLSARKGVTSPPAPPEAPCTRRIKLKPVRRAQ